MMVSGEYIITYEVHNADGSVKQRGSMSLSVSESNGSEILNVIRKEVGTNNYSITGIYKL